MRHHSNAAGLSPRAAKMRLCHFRNASENFVRRSTAGRIPHRSIKLEMRANLIRHLKQDEQLFPGIIGYEDTVIPQITNAILSQHNFVLLGLRGQAKTRILRGLTTLLDDELPVVPGCQINDDPLAPVCRACRTRVAEEGDAMPIGWLSRERRLVEKLATPDVTIADMIGDIDPIKAVRARDRAVGRSDDALRPAASGQPLCLRHQRAAGSGRQDPGWPVQHPPGG